MTLPAENFVAAFPPSRKAGNVTLNPLTLGGAIKLSREGVDCGKTVPKDRVFNAAFVLSGESDYNRFLRRAKCGMQELCNAVETILNDAFATFIKPGKDKNATETVTPHGLGWALELVEFLCAEYGWSWTDALNTPVATAWALIACSRQRHGAPKGDFDYIERLYAKDLKAGRAKGIRV